MIKDSKTSAELNEKAKLSPKNGKHGPRKSTIALQKAIKEKANDIADEWIFARNNAVRAITKKKLQRESAKNNAYVADLLNKNIRLEKGKATNIVDIPLLDIDEIRQDDSNNQSNAPIEKN